MVDKENNELVKKESKNKDEVVETLSKDHEMFKSFIEIQLQEIESKKSEIELNREALKLQSKDNDHIFTLEETKLKNQYSLDKDDRKHKTLYIILFFILLFVVIISIILGVANGKESAIKDFIDPLVKVVMGLLGGYGLGYYRGRNKSEEK